MRVVGKGVGPAMVAVLALGCGMEEERTERGARRPAVPSEVPVQAITQPVVQAGGCSYGLTPDQIAVHVDSSGFGLCAVLSIYDNVGYGPGFFPTAQSIGLPNDSISSVYLGSNVQVLGFDHTEFGNFEALLQDDVGYLGNANDSWTSLRIERLGEVCGDLLTIPAGQACFFPDGGFKAYAVDPAWYYGPYFGGSKRGVGSYPTAAHMGIGNDQISSFRVGSGVVARVCRDANFGDCVDAAPGEYDGPTLLLGNDQISSFKILSSCRNWGGNACGGLSASGACYCDANCAIYGDCCFDKTSVCGPH